MNPKRLLAAMRASAIAVLALAGITAVITVLIAIFINCGLAGEISVVGFSLFVVITGLVYALDDEGYYE